MSTRNDLARRRMLVRRRRTFAAFIALLVLLGGGYVAAAAIAPLPAPEITLAVAHEEVIEADHAAAQATVDSQSLPTAIGWAHNDAVWSNDENPYPIASITKLVTVLVGLEAEPLAPGEDGPTYTWTAADQQITADYLAMNGIVHPTAVGTERTMREMLTLMLLPSSNDYASVYANWVFGSNEAFVEAATQFAERHELDSLRITEPTGLSAENVATAADTVRLARIAVQNETLVELTSTQSAQLPGIGVIINTNPLLGVTPGVIGLKTGSLTAVGYNLALAQREELLTRDIIKLSVTLARESIIDRAASGSEMLDRLSALPAEVTLVEIGETVGTATTAWGETTELVTTNGAVTVLLPGEAALRTVFIESGTSANHIPLGAEAGTTVGSIKLQSVSGSDQVSIVTTSTLEEPGFWWRLTHPRALLGW